MHARNFEAVIFVLYLAVLFTQVRRSDQANPIIGSADPNDPCAPYDPPVPDFSAPGRRISEIKCYEYIWEVKKRDDIEKRIEECSALHPAPGIISGHITKRGEYPHMGAIGWKVVVGTWKFMCGSTIISPHFVLTAAHCSRASDLDTTLADPVPKIVRLGVQTILEKKYGNGDAYDEKIVNIIVHPEYKSPKMYFDIALIELERTLRFNMDLQPACLWTQQEITSKRAEISGWGVVKTGSRETSPQLLAAEIDIIDSASCDNLLRSYCNRNWCGLKEHQLCAGNLTGGTDTCQGDSGGPLQVKIPLPIRTQGNMYFVLGVTSFGKGCGAADQPGVYTRVSSFRDWIEDIVWPKQS